MQLLIDMNLSPRWIRALEQGGFYALHWSQIGSYDASDQEILRYAVKNELIVLTADLDFSAIMAASGEQCPSIVQLRIDDVSPETCHEIVMSALSHCENELIRGALLTIDVVRYRVRMLPLTK